MNNFFTVLVIPEKTKQVRKIVIPAVYLRIGILLGSVGAFFGAFMIYDYVNVMRQLSENKRLQTENRQLKQQMQTFTTKLQTVEDTLERIKTFKMRLQIITNQATGNIEVLKEKAAPEIPGVPMDDHSGFPSTVPPSGHGGFRDDCVPKALRGEKMPSYCSHLLVASTDPLDSVKIARELEKRAEEGTSNLEQNQQKEVERKRLADLIQEDEEKESQELRDEFSKLHRAFDGVLQHELSEELEMQALFANLIDQKDQLQSTPTLKPTNGWYTSGFGSRNSPFTGKPTMHEGLDIANHVGSPVLAPAVGIVTFAGQRAGYGNLISVNHGYGYQTQYGHVSKIYVHVGEKVKRGQKLGAVGNTGRSTGPHVHYEVRTFGTPVNPQFYILED